MAKNVNSKVIKKDIDKRINKSVKPYKKEIRNRFQQLNRALVNRIAVIGVLSLIFILVVNLFIGRYIERKVKSETYKFIDEQEMILNDYKQKLEHILDSISGGYKKELYGKIENEIESDSFKEFSVHNIQKRFDKVVPGIIEDKINRSTLMLERETKRFLDSLYKSDRSLSVMKNE